MPVNVVRTNNREPGAADLRFPVVIQSATETQAADGAVVQAWATHSATRAKIEPVTGSEAYKSEGAYATVTHRVWVRYQAGVTPKMRLLYGGRVLEILRVTNVDERQRWLELDCVEAV